MKKPKSVPPFKQPTHPPLPAKVEEQMKRKMYARLTLIGPAESKIRNIRKAITNNEQPNPDELLNLLNGFERVLAGEKPSDVFGFWVGRGRPREQENRFRDQRIAYEVAELRKYGTRLEEALELVAKRYKKSESVINKIYQKQERLIRNSNN